MNKNSKCDKNGYEEPRSLKETFKDNKNVIPLWKVRKVTIICKKIMDVYIPVD